jgi:hypothetical protein
MSESHSHSQSQSQSQIQAMLDEQFAALKVEIESGSLPSATITPATMTEISSRCVGITNVLKGIISNSKKGKVTSLEKDYLLTQLSQTLRALQEIDCDAAIEARNERIKIHSSIDSRL